MAAASKDIAVTEAFLRVLGLIDPASRLLRPSMLMRVIVGNLRPANARTVRVSGL